MKFKLHQSLLAAAVFTSLPLVTGCTTAGSSSGSTRTRAPTTTNREYDTARGVPTTARETGALQGQTTRAATGNPL